MLPTSLPPVYLLEGEGIDPVCLEHTYHLFERKVNNPIRKISYTQLINSLPTHGTLVVSGGNAVTQSDCISDGAAHIINFLVTQRGLNYFGICAGAYLGNFLKLIEMRPQRSSSAKENQKLRFRQIQTTSKLDNKVKQLSAFYFGGPEFSQDKIKNEPNVTSLVDFTDGEKGSAVIAKTNARSIAIFSSYHPEFTKDFDLNIVPIDLHHLDFSAKHFKQVMENNSSKLDEITTLCFLKLGLDLKPET